jgi:hypothetical protein
MYSKKKIRKKLYTTRKNQYKIRKQKYKISIKDKTLSGGGSINDVAILIPISPKGYSMLYNLCSKCSLNNIQVDIYLVFSSQVDYDNFEMKTCIKPIIIGPEVDMTNKTAAIVTFKKFFGLNTLVESKYEYIICCDDDLDVIPENFTNDNLKDKITHIFDNKMIYAGIITPESTTPIKTRIIPHLSQEVMQNAQKALIESAKLFPNEYERLKGLTNNFTLYFWWSDLPVYKRDNLKNFLETINYNSIDYTNLSNSHDQIMYLFYLIIKDNFKIVDTTPILKINYSLEYLDINDTQLLDKLVDLKYGFSWVNNIMYNTMKEYLLSHKTIFIFSTDRQFIL